MYASTLLSCRTSGRPPKREGARPPLFGTHRSRLARLGPEGVSRSRAAPPRIPRIDPRNRPSQHLVTGRAGILGQFEGIKWLYSITYVDRPAEHFLPRRVETRQQRPVEA